MQDISCQISQVFTKSFLISIYPTVMSIFWWLDYLKNSTYPCMLLKQNVWTLESLRKAKSRKSWELLSAFTRKKSRLFLKRGVCAFSMNLLIFVAWIQREASAFSLRSSFRDSVSFFLCVCSFRVLFYFPISFCILDVGSLFLRFWQFVVLT